MCSMSRNDPPSGSVPWAKGLGALRQRVSNMAWPSEGRDSREKSHSPNGKEGSSRVGTEDDVEESHRN